MNVRGWVVAAVLVLAGCNSTSQPPPVDALVEGPEECTPVTCEEASAQCGKITDGCGGVLECGSCAEGETCGAAGPNRCGVGQCQPRSCAGSAVSCGALTDGCGGIAECGACAAGSSCNAGQCVCTPKTCADAGATCGDVADGCGGVLNCGACAAGQTCGGGGANRCGAATCVAKTCASAGAQCGSINDGCGAVVSCGTCSAGQTCATNACVCKPKTCAELGKSCGSVPDGCGGTLSCGVCAAGQACNASNSCEAIPAPSCSAFFVTTEKFEFPVDTFQSGVLPGTNTVGDYAIVAWKAPRSGTFVFDTATSIAIPELYRIDDCAGTNRVDGTNGGAGFHSLSVNAVAGSWYLLVVGRPHGDNAARGDIWMHGSPAEAQEASCSDRADNDGDGRFDCTDPSCAGNSACSGLACLAQDIGSAVPTTSMGSTVGMRNFFAVSGASMAAEHVFAWTAPRNGTFVFSLDQGHSEVRVVRGCSGFTFAAEGTVDLEPPAVRVTMTAGQRVLIAVSRQDGDLPQYPMSGFHLGIDELRADEAGRCDDDIDNDDDGVQDIEDSDCHAGP